MDIILIHTFCITKLQNELIMKNYNVVEKLPSCMKLTFNHQPFNIRSKERGGVQNLSSKTPEHQCNEILGQVRPEQ